MIGSVIDLCQRSPVLANNLMLVMIFSGIAAITQMNREDMPRVRPSTIAVPIHWPDADASVIEGRVVAPIERALDGITGSKRIRSEIWAGGAAIHIEAASLDTIGDLLDRVVTAVASVGDLPRQMTTPRPLIVDPDPTIIEIAVTGVLDPLALRDAAQRLRQTLLRDGDIAQAEIVGGTAIEWQVTADAATLAQNGISPTDLRADLTSRLLPNAGGLLNHAGQHLQMRQIPGPHNVASLRALEITPAARTTTNTATGIALADLATVTEVPPRQRARVTIDGQPAMLLRIQQGLDQDILRIAEQTRQLTTAFNHAEEKRGSAIIARIADDRSRDFRARVTTLSSSGISGSVLVLAVLLLFLPWRAAWWIAAGIPVALLGGLGLAWVYGLSINAVSLFTMIVTVGLVVDDAIIIGDGTQQNIRKDTQQGLQPRRLARPVIAAGLTTMLAFFPFQLLGGQMGDRFAVISTMVILALIASLIECLLILPHHLKPRSATKKPSLLEVFFAPLQAIGNGTIRMLWNVLLPIIDGCIRWRYATLAATIALMSIAIGLFASGRIANNFFPAEAESTLVAHVQLPVSAEAERTKVVLSQVAQAARTALNELGATRSGLITYSA
jgi:multidrug efflux pump subunit AcrB